MTQTTANDTGLLARLFRRKVRGALRTTTATPTHDGQYVGQMALIQSRTGYEGEEYSTRYQSYRFSQWDGEAWVRCPYFKVEK